MPGSRTRLQEVFRDGRRSHWTEQSLGTSTASGGGFGGFVSCSGRVSVGFFPKSPFGPDRRPPPQNNSDQLRSCNSLRSPGGELLTTLPQDLVARVAGWGWGRRLRCVRWSGDLVLTGHERSGCPWEVQLSYGRRWTTHKAKHGYPSPGWRATVLWTEQCLFWCASHASHWISGLPQEG